MRGLMRNKRWVFYKNFVKTEYLLDENNRKTGYTKTVYSDVRKFHVSVSTPTGNSVVEMFGTDEKYDKVVVSDKPDIEITENSVLWIDKKYGENTAYDYVVKKIMKNHNFLFIGVRKVDVRNAETNQNQANG